MASRRPVGMKSRTMGPASSTSMSPTTHTAPYYDKYDKTRPSIVSSLSVCARLRSYKNSFVFLCLCLWGLSVLIFVIFTLKSNASNSSILPRNVNTHRNTQLHDEEPPWKHPIQPWEILPRPPKGTPPPMKCTWEGPFDGFLAGCANDNCRNQDNLDTAKELCSKDELCTGLIKIAQNREIYQLRSGGKISNSPSGEQSYRKSCVVDEEKLSAAQQQKAEQKNGKDKKNKDKDKDKDKKDKMIDMIDRLQHVGSVKHDLIPDAQHSIQHQDLHLESNDNNDNNDNKESKQVSLVSETDPWYEWIPDMAKHASNNGDGVQKRHYVYDDSHHGGYQRPFGESGGANGDANDEPNLDQKVATLKQELIDPNTKCFLEGPLNGFIANCAEDNCENHQNLETAIDKCLEQPQCTGVVQIVQGQSIYQLRSDKQLRESPRGEQTWVKLCGEKALQRIAEIAAETPPPKCYPYGPIKGFLGNCAGTECLRFYYFNDAMVECDNMGRSKCVGITRIPGLKKSFELRAIPPVIASVSGEYSYLLECGDGGGGGDGDAAANRGEGEGEEEREERLPVIDLMEDALLDEYEKLGSIIEIDDHHTNERVRLPSIYIGIASYRDPWCYKSVHTAFARARYPERVFVGVVQQNAEEDPDCITPQTPCDEDPTQVLCKYVDHIRVKKFHASEAAGPTFGRHHADTMYGGEYFAVQVDAHMSFIKDWDMVVIEQWRSLDNEYAVLTTYPSEIKSGLDEYGNPLSETAPVICHTRLLRNGMFKHEAAGEIRLPDSHKDKPLFTPYLGAGVVFSRGHRIVRVPYDCCLPMVFDGEEFSMGARLWTNGYDLYAPSKSFAYHPYNRKKRPPLFWENQDNGRSARAHNRIKKILGMALPFGQHDDYDATEIARYGLGKYRKFDTFLRVFGIDLDTKEIYNHCSEVFSGALHDRLHAYLRPNKRGIDYDYVYIPKDHQTDEEDEDDDDDDDDDDEEAKEKKKPSKRKMSYLNVESQKEQKRKIDHD